MERNLREHNASDAGSAMVMLTSTMVSKSYQEKGLTISLFLFFKGYKGTEYKKCVENVILEREQSQAHVAEDDVLSQEVHKFKQLKTKQRPKPTG